MTRDVIFQYQHFVGVSEAQVTRLQSKPCRAVDVPEKEHRQEPGAILSRGAVPDHRPGDRREEPLGWSWMAETSSASIEARRANRPASAAERCVSAAARSADS